MSPFVSRSCLSKVGRERECVFSFMYRYHLYVLTQVWLCRKIMYAWKCLPDTGVLNDLAV